MRTPRLVEIEHEDAAAAAAFHQVVRPLPVRTRRRAVGGDAASCPVAGASALTAHQRGIGKRQRWADGADGVANTCTSRPSSATAMPPSGRQHSAVIGRSKRLQLGGGRAVEAQDRRAVGDDRAPCRRWRGPRARRTAPTISASSSIWFGFSAPSNDGTVMVASPRPSRRSVKSLQRCDHAALPPAPVVLDEIGVGACRACSGRCGC